MKTFITSVVAAFIILSSSAFTAREGKAARSNVVAINNVLDQYIAAVSKGQVSKVEQLFSEQFHQRYTNSKQNNTFSKSQVVSFLKANKNIEQQHCKTDYSIVDEGKGFAIAKVAMNYPSGYTRTDYVTVTQNNGIYQINQVITTFS